MLRQNEELLKNNGYKPPVRNYVVDNEERIWFPSGYIRTSNEFSVKYHLNNIVKSKNAGKNIAYSLQLSDYYNYFLNRFYLWGSVRTMLYKQDIINLVSILEALVTEATENILMCCKKCKKINTCKNRINQRQQDNLKYSLPFLKQRNIMELDDCEINRIIELYDLRNRIHIRLAEENEFLDDSFCRNTHNELICILQKVTENLNEKAVPMYGICNDFEEGI